MVRSGIKSRWENIGAKDERVSDNPSEALFAVEEMDKLLKEWKETEDAGESIDFNVKRKPGNLVELVVQ